METTVHPNALKHISEEEVRYAWGTVSKCIQRQSKDEPPRWLAIGWLPDGRPVEIIAVELITGWLIIHANSPVAKKFSKEIEQAERRSR